MQTIEGSVAVALIEERKRLRGIIAASSRFRVASAAVQEAILSDTSAEAFARHHEIELMARQIASA